MKKLLITSKTTFGSVHQTFVWFVNPITDKVAIIDIATQKETIYKEEKIRFSLRADRKLIGAYDCDNATAKLVILGGGKTIFVGFNGLQDYDYEDETVTFVRINSKWAKNEKLASMGQYVDIETAYDIAVKKNLPNLAEIKADYVKYMSEKDQKAKEVKEKNEAFERILVLEKMSNEYETNEKLKHPALSFNKDKNLHSFTVHETGTWGLSNDSGFIGRKEKIQYIETDNEILLEKAVSELAYKGDKPVFWLLRNRLERVSYSIDGEMAIAYGGHDHNGKPNRIVTNSLCDFYAKIYALGFIWVEGVLYEKVPFKGKVVDSLPEEFFIG